MTTLETMTTRRSPQASLAAAILSYFLIRLRRGALEILVAEKARRAELERRQIAAR